MGGLNFDDLIDAVSTDKQRGDPYFDDIVSELRDDDSLDVPIEMTDLDAWCNFISDDVYHLDKKVREFLKKTRYKRESKDGYRTTVQVVFAWIFGRAPEPDDGSVCRLLHKLLRYYCTRHTGRTTYKGKPVTCVYYFSKFSGNNKRPYSLKLRMEEANGKGNPFRKGPGSHIA